MRADRYQPKWYTNLFMKGPWVKWPVWLYRMRLGWLLDHRALMVTHIGRKTGKVHQTVVELLRYDPATQESVVVSGLGEQSDWYRNVRERGALLVDIGPKTYAPSQRELDEEARYQELLTYRREHKLIAKMVFLLMAWDYDAPEADQRRLAQFVRMFAFRPNQPPQQR